MCGFQRTPAQTGKQGLFRLVKQAHELYKEEVATRQKSYKRYVRDFINSKQFHDATDAWSKNEHQKNYHTVVDLLNDHEELVCKYFGHERLDNVHITALLNEFYAFDFPKPVASETGSNDMDGPQSSETNVIKEFQLHRDTIDLIVQLANEVKLFKETLDADDVADRYATGKLQTVTSTNNTRFVLLMDKLASQGIINYNWQSVIAKKELVISSSGKKTLDQHNMSSTLNRVRETPPGVAEKKYLALIDKYIERIKGNKME